MDSLFADSDFFQANFGYTVKSEAITDGSAQSKNNTSNYDRWMKYNFYIIRSGL